MASTFVSPKHTPFYIGVVVVVSDVCWWRVRDNDIFTFQHRTYNPCHNKAITPLIFESLSRLNTHKLQATFLVWRINYVQNVNLNSIKLNKFVDLYFTPWSLKFLFRTNYRPTDEHIE